MNKQRILAVDILRGLTIIFMIIVNDPGSWSHVYRPLLHAEWNGLTPTDYIFPTFLFIMGTSIVLSLSNRAKNTEKLELVKKIFWRSFKIYAVGLFLWLWPEFNFERIRWVGVLPRIAFVYFFVALFYVYTSKRTQFYVAAGLLFAYLLLMCFVPVPGIGFPDLSIPEKNWAHYIDNFLLPGVLWQKTWDPEGILSTFPAIATGLLGVFAGYIITSKKELSEKLAELFVMGTILLILGDLTQYIFPLNKSLWSTSFTLMVGGISTLGLGFFIFICDVKKWGSYFRFAQEFGVNSIFSYVLAGMLTLIFYSSRLWGFKLSGLFMDIFTTLGMAPKLTSLIYAILYTTVIWVPVHYLFKKKIFIKL
jgi:predicted acyltransferase